MTRRDYGGIYFIPSPARKLDESNRIMAAIDNSMKTTFERKDYDWADHLVWAMRSRLLQSTPTNVPQSEGHIAEPPSFQHIFQLYHLDQEDQEPQPNQVNPERAYCFIQKPAVQQPSDQPASQSTASEIPYTPRSTVEVMAESAENHINFLETTGLWSFRRAYEIQDGQTYSLVRMHDPEKRCDVGTFHVRVGVVTTSRERRFGGDPRWDTTSPGVIVEITYKNVTGRVEGDANDADNREEYTQALVDDAQEHIRGLWQRLQSGLSLAQPNSDIKEVMMGPEPLKPSAAGGGEAQRPVAIVRMWCEMLRRL